MLIYALRSHRTSRRWVARALFVASSLALAAGVAFGQGRPYGYVFLKGADTLGIERVTRGPGRMQAVVTFTGQPRIEWSADLTPRGGITTLGLTAFKNNAPDAPVVQRATISFKGDTALAELSGASGASTTQRIPSKASAFPLLNASAAQLDLLLDIARSTPAIIDTLPVFLVSGGQTLNAVIRLAGDSGFVSVAGLETKLVVRGGVVTEALVAAQNLVMRRVEGAALSAIKIGGPDYGAPSGAPYTAEQVAIAAAGGHTLAGTLTIPAQRTGRVPAIITITGSGGQDRDEYISIVAGYRPFRQLADTLGRVGIAALRYDDRGVGESGGSFAGSTSRDFANDAIAAVRFLRTRTEIDPARIFLVGHSEGGLISPMVAADDAALAGIVLLAGPAKNGLDIIKFQQRYALESDPRLTTPSQRDSAAKVAAAQLDSTAKSDAWIRFFLTYDPLATARRVKVPVFVVQGASDRQVTAEQADMLGKVLRESGNKDVTVQVFPDLNHLFLKDPTGNPANYSKLEGRVGSDVMGAVVDWIAVRAKAKRGHQ